MHRRYHAFPLFPAVSSLAGLIFCLWVMLSGGEALCLTDGCSLFQDFKLAGISLWQAGTALFSLLLLCAASKSVRPGFFLSGAALAADTILLAVMLFTAPCMNCLIVGLLIALTFLTFLRDSAPQRHARRSPLLILWLLFFLFDIGAVVRGAAKPWSPLDLDEAPAVSIFFSPSCRACQTLVDQAERIGTAIWFPVAEDERDIWVIHAMTSALEQGIPLREAVRQGQLAVPGLADFADASGYRIGLLKPEMLLLQFRLWKNHAAALASGSDRLPLVQFMGVPRFMRETPPPATLEHSHAPFPAPSDDASPTGIPGILDFGVAGFCGGEKKNDSCKEDSASPVPLIDTSGLLR